MNYELVKRMALNLHKQATGDVIEIDYPKGWEKMTMEERTEALKLYRRMRNPNKPYDETK